jgi:hypothetical protein
MTALDCNHRLSERPINYHGGLNMIKHLAFTAAQLASGVAFAANPSASFSDQVVSAGSDPIACDVGVPYTGSIPAAAQAAGFTHCVANYDFTNASFSNPNVWLASGNGSTCNALNPVLWVTNYGDNAYAPCSRFRMVNDTANGGASQVLRVSFLKTDTYASTLLSTISNIGLPNPPGVPMYNGWYSEEVFRLDTSYAVNSSCPAGGTQPCMYFAYWTFPFTCPGACADDTMEFDFIEAYAQQGPPNNGAPNAGGAINGGAGVGFWNPGPYSPSQFITSYNTLGEMATVTNGGSPNYAACWYVNGTTIGCVPKAVTQADITNAKFGIALAQVGPEWGGISPQINQYLYIERVTIWACSNYATSPCYSSSLVTQ